MTISASVSLPKTPPLHPKSLQHPEQQPPIQAIHMVKWTWPFANVILAVCGLAYLATWSSVNLWTWECELGKVELTSLRCGLGNMELTMQQCELCDSAKQTDKVILE
ncbi:unnamed protein product [Sphagnum jensenii]|uniref:ATP synthase F0 subunit 8 n=1 Tax=Sphagnum jensenii TaxID=128206 RepID=A0ABP1AUW6_9BRYO